MEKRETVKELLKHRYAHRGFHNKPAVPENSMLAFERAMAEGFGIELDVHLTGDNKLAVIHDASLKRTCGIDLNIEEITLEECRMYFLEESREHIPEFREVLERVSGRVPLIIELKVVDGNEEALCKKLLECLKGYRGLYCVESFDPKAVRWMRNNAPELVRGQLAGALKKNGVNMSAITDFLLKNLWVNLSGKPDFVAYRFEDRDESAFKNYKGAKFMWTIREYSDLKITEEIGAAPIFEQFNPKDYERSL